MNLLISIAGKPKSGKTHLALTSPDPICVFSFDIRGAELLVSKFPKKQIEVKRYLPPISDTLEPGKESLELWLALKEDFRKTEESGEFKTIVLDPATILWEIIRNAYTVENERKRLMRRDYGEPNARITWMLTSPIVSGMNVVSINYLKDVYVDDKATGEMELDGFKRTEGLSDVLLLTEMIGEGKNAFVQTRIEKARFDRTLSGMKLKDTTFDEVYTLLGLS